MNELQPVQPERWIDACCIRIEPLRSGSAHGAYGRPDRQGSSATDFHKGGSENQDWNYAFKLRFLLLADRDNEPGPVFACPQLKPLGWVRMPDRALEQGGLLAC